MLGGEAGAEEGASKIEADDRVAIFDQHLPDFARLGPADIFHQHVGTAKHTCGGIDYASGALGLVM